MAEAFAKGNLGRPTTCSFDKLRMHQDVPFDRLRMYRLRMYRLRMYKLGMYKLGMYKLGMYQT